MKGGLNKRVYKKSRLQKKESFNFFKTFFILYNTLIYFGAAKEKNKRRVQEYN